MKKFEIEKDPELEDLLAKCKKKGLNFGLALGSGSARGMAHIGVIQVLEAYHIPIDMIAGTSIGSVVGSLYAAGASIEQLKETALSMKWSKTISLMDPTIPHSGLLSGNRVEKHLKELFLNDKTFNDLKIPFATVATDVDTGAKVILNQGNVLKAVRASLSIPGIFAPVKYHDYYLVDGGVVDPVPVDLLQQMGANIIIAVSLAIKRPHTITLMINKETGALEEIASSDKFQIKKEGRLKLRVVEKIASLVNKEKDSLKKKIDEVKVKLESPNIFEVLAQSIYIMEAEITSQCLIGADVVIVPFEIEKVSLLEFNKAETLIEGGIKATLINLPEIKRIIREKIAMTKK